MAKTTKKPSTVVSDGNDKIGNTPNVSLLPIITCPKGVPCAGKCYCQKALRTYPEVLKKWHANTVKWMNDPAGFRDDVEEQLKKRKPEYFRWFVAGDIPDARFLTMMKNIAASFPGTRFLAFTKRYEFFGTFIPGVDHFQWYSREFMHIPDNLTIVLSRWGSWKQELWDRQTKLEFPTSAVIFPSGFVIPAPTPGRSGEFHCSGKCEGCRLCWKLDPGEIVYFEEH